jgi:hypothetical protein
VAVQCDVCRQREATGGNVRRVEGKDVTTHYCDECRSKVPLGHSAWATATARPYPWARFGISLLIGSLLVILAIAILWWRGR